MPTHSLIYRDSWVVHTEVSWKIKNFTYFCGFSKETLYANVAMLLIA